MPDPQVRFLVSAGVGDDGVPLVSIRWASDNGEGDFLLSPSLATRLSASLATAVQALGRAGHDVDGKVETHFFVDKTKEDENG